MSGSVLHDTAWVGSITAKPTELKRCRNVVMTEFSLWSIEFTHGNEKSLFAKPMLALSKKRNTVTQNNQTYGKN